MDVHVPCSLILASEMMFTPPTALALNVLQILLVVHSYHQELRFRGIYVVCRSVGNLK